MVRGRSLMAPLSPLLRAWPPWSSPGQSANCHNSNIAGRDQMSLEPRSGARLPYATVLDLPPPFRCVTLREVGDALAHAIRIAPQEGAGTLVLVGRFDLVEFALVLEPAEPLRTARRAFYAGIAALADALVLHAPPQKLIYVEWPDAIFVDGALVGGGRLAWPADAAENEVPPWLVFGAMVRTAAMSPVEPGRRPGATTLEDEGFETLATEKLVESFARHFMVLIDAWQDEGFAAVARSYLPRLSGASGLRRDIDENGDLLVRRAGDAAATRRSLIAALAAVEWFDPESGGPRL